MRKRKFAVIPMMLCFALLLGIFAMPSPVGGADGGGYWNLIAAETFGITTIEDMGYTLGVEGGMGQYRFQYTEAGHTLSASIKYSGFAETYKSGDTAEVSIDCELNGGGLIGASVIFRSYAYVIPSYTLEEAKRETGLTNVSYTNGSLNFFRDPEGNSYLHSGMVVYEDTPPESNGATFRYELQTHEDYHTDYLTFVEYIVSPFDEITLFGTNYIYEWTTPEKEKENVDRSFRVNGFVENAALEEMGGLSVTAELIDLKNPDFYSPAFAEETTRTDDYGMFFVYFDVPDEVEIPAVRVRVTLQYLDADMTPLLRFIDCWDSRSVEKEQMMISARVTLSADEIFQVDHGEIPTKYLGLSFANLLGENPTFAYGDDASDYQISLEDKITVIRAEKWGVDPDTGESVLIREEANLGTFTAEKRMADASLLYKTARDAHRFASEWLVNEADAMKAAEIRIRLRDREATDVPSSWFRGDTMSIYLEAPDCVRDDNGIAVLLHEFGHAADFLTGDKEHHVSSYEGDENHGGIFNATMADSYTEGFATFFASMVKKYMSYPGDAKHLNAAMSFDTKAARSVYANNGSNEEIAIAAFLYSADAALGIKKLWPVLDEKRGFFKDYYDAIMGTVSKSNAAKLESVAESMYLYTVPLAGNGKYDEGEPFNDKNNDWVRGTDEEYYDLPFTWSGDLYSGYQSSGCLDPAAWEANKDSRTFGLVQDKNRADTKPRFAPAKPDFGYLSLGGEEVDYVLVTVRPTGEEEEAFSELRRVWGGEVFLVDPRLYTGGTVSVSVPGGGFIYEASIDDLKESLRERGKDDYLALAYVTADQLAPADVIPIPTYGDVGATGYVVKQNLTEAEIIGRIAAGGGHDSGKYDTSGYRAFDFGRFLKWMLFAVTGVVVIILLVVISKKRGQKKAAHAVKAAETAARRAGIDPATFSIPQNQYAQQQLRKPSSLSEVQAHRTSAQQNSGQVRFCRECGTSVQPGARFCLKCGAAVSAPENKPALCPFCDSPLPEGTKTCPHCGGKKE